MYLFATVFKKYKKRITSMLEVICVFAFCVLISNSSFSQNKIVAGEYFFDTDPGIKGVGTNSISVVSGSEINLVNLSIPQNIGAGFHTLNVRFKNDKGVWSHTEAANFYVVNNQKSNRTNIVLGEYFFDTDPGISGTGTFLISVTKGNTIDIANLAIPQSLSLGFHTLNVRFKNESGQWSHTESSMLYIVNNQQSNTTNILSGEYFFDTDPGINSSGTFPISVTKGTIIDITNLALPQSLAVGFHTVNIRFKNDRGQWGLTDAASLYVQKTANTTLQASEIVKGEYFFDADSGISKNTFPIPLNQGLDIDIPSLTIPQSLVPGNHTINVRFKNALGQWSHIEGAEINVRAPYSLLKPISTTQYTGCTTDSIKWNRTDITTYRTNIDYSLNNGLTWYPIVRGHQVTNSLPSFYMWNKIPSVGATNVKIKIYDADAVEVKRISDAFTIKPSTLTNSISLIYPNSSISLPSFSEQTIRWKTIGNIPKVNVLFSSDSGNTWQTLAANITNQDSLNWNSVPLTFSTKCLIKVEDIANLCVFDYNDNYFIIGDKPSIKVLKPNGGEYFVKGAKAIIEWNSTNIAPTQSVKIEYSSNKGLNWQLLKDTLNTGSYSWRIGNPIITSNQYLIKVSFEFGSQIIKDSSNSVFTIAAPKVDNTFDNPIVLSLANLPLTVRDTTNRYTDNYTGSSNQSSQDIFYKFKTPSCIDSITISTCSNSDFDTYLHLLDKNGSLILDNDNFCGQSSLIGTRTLLPNTDYYIVIEGKQNASGIFNLTITPYTLSVSLGSDKVLCPKDSLVLKVFKPINSKVTWLTGNIKDTLSYLIVKKQGTYITTITKYNCTRNDTIRIDTIKKGSITGKSIATQGEALAYIYSITPGTNKWTLFNNQNNIISQKNTSDFQASISLLGRYKLLVSQTYASCVIPIVSDTFFIQIGSRKGDKLSDPKDLTGTTFDAKMTIKDTSYLFTNQFQIANRPGSSPDVFFKFKGPSCTDSMIFSTCNSAFKSIIYLLDSKGLLIDSSSKGCTGAIGARLASRSIKQDSVYYIVVDGYKNDIGTFELAIEKVKYKIELGPNRTVCAGSIITLNSGHQSGSIFWKNLNDLQFQSSSNTISVNKSGTYTVSVTKNGCTFKDTVSIQFSNLTIGTFASISPADSSKKQSLPLTFSWQNAVGATSYKLIVWKTDSLKPDSIIRSGITTNSFQVSNLSYGQSYRWQVVAQNACVTSKSGIKTFATKQLPDLVAYDVMIQDSIPGGDKLKVKWKIKNIGNESTLNAPWKVKIYLSDDSTFSAFSDVLLQTIDKSTNLDNATSILDSFFVTTPIRTKGSKYVIVIPSDIVESNYVNNSGYSKKIKITQAILPDLIVLSGKFDKKIFIENTTLNFSYYRKNIGFKEIDIVHYDQVYLSNDSIFSRDDQYIKEIKQAKLTNIGPGGQILPFQIEKFSLAPNKSDTTIVNIPIDFNIPRSDSFYVFIQSDARNIISNEWDEGNNIKQIGKIYIKKREYPDLIASAISLDDTLKAGTKIVISYTLKNIGREVISEVSSWFDYAYLNRKESFNLDSSILLYSPMYRSLSLKVNESKNITDTLTIPSTLSGKYFLTLKINQTNTLQESNSSNNIYTTSKSIFIKPSTYQGVPCDGFNNACPISIGEGNYGYGTFSLDLYPNTATLELGEQLPDNTLKHTLWYKLVLPTTRWVQIRVPEQFNFDHQGGKTNFYVDVFKKPTFNGLPPQREFEGGSDLAEFIQYQYFGSTTNICLNEGLYYIRFSSSDIKPELLNTPIKAFIELASTSEKQTQSEYDKTSNAFLFPEISNSRQSSKFSTGCLSIDSKDEVFQDKNNTIWQDYKQTNWHVFKTGDHLDGLRIAIDREYANEYSPIGLILYKGNGLTESRNSLEKIESRVFQRRYLYDTAAYYDLSCVFEPNTHYTVQLFFKSGLQDYYYLSLEGIGVNASLGADPSVPVELGVLPSSTTDIGALKSHINYFDCKSKISNYVSCSTIIPPIGSFDLGNDLYNLSNWYTFKLDKASNLKIDLYGSQTYLKYVRIYSGDSKQCSKIVLIDSITSLGEPYSLNCFSAGTYTIQILGQVNPKNLFDPYSNLGKQFKLNIYTQSAKVDHQFNLADSLHLNYINKVNNSWVALQPNIRYQSIADSLGCSRTPLPSILPNSQKVINAIYRTVKISQSGLLSIYQLQGANSNTLSLRYMLYKGYPFDSKKTYKPTDVVVFEKNLYKDNTFRLSENSPTLFCLDQGIYTLVTLGESDQIRFGDQPIFKFDLQSQPKFSTPLKAENMGDITSILDSGLAAVSQTDAFTCEISTYKFPNNKRCYNPNKLHFRQFYIAKPTNISISSNFNISYGNFVVFKGKVSEALIKNDTIQLEEISISYSSEASSCIVYNWKSNICNELPAGWYTIVSFIGQELGTYNGPDYLYQYYQSGYTIRKIDNKAVRKYNTPSSAYVHKDTLEWKLNDIISDYQFPVFTQNISFGKDEFTCISDIVQAGKYLNILSGFNRVSFYVFTLSKGKDYYGNLYPDSLAKEYFLRANVPLGFKFQLFNKDIRKDSANFKSYSPIEGCCESELRFCRFLPGTYTMIVFANDDHIFKSVTPSITIDKVEKSRYDHFKNAYDFDSIPGNGSLYTKALRDYYKSNPDYTSRTFSNTFFSCLTGSGMNDPKGYVNELNDEISYCHAYGQVNNPEANHYPVVSNKSQGTDKRKNIWYTFRVSGAGEVNVTVFNKTYGLGGPKAKAKDQYQQELDNILESFNGIQYPFSIYYAPDTTEGYTDFKTLNKLGKLDSLDVGKKGLQFLMNNTRLAAFKGCAKSNPTLTWQIDPCSYPKKRRYFVIVENYKDALPNSQVEVGVTFNSVPSNPTRNDYYSQAISISSKKDSSALEKLKANKTYIGSASTLSCATLDAADQVSCGSQTIWYKFNSVVSGKIRMRYQVGDSLEVSKKYILTENGIDSIVIKKAQFRFNDSIKSDEILNEELVLYKELIPGDSSILGLRKIKLIRVKDSKEYWGEGCVNSGVYYLAITGCFNKLANLRPIITLIPENGDLCRAPYNLAITQKNKKYSISGPVDCHSWGEDFGEDFSNTGCFFDGSTFSYPKLYKNKNLIKSTWFKFRIGDIGAVNLKFEVNYSNLNLQKPSYDSLIKFRIFYGTCSAMRGGSECSNSPRQQFTVDCRAPNNDYFVQVVTPYDYKGNAEVSITVQNPTDTTCKPTDFRKPLADFTVSNSCQGVPICFNNLSTAGDSITYDWSFGIKDSISTLKSPCFTYPRNNKIDQYSVRLIVKNISNNFSDTLVKIIKTQPFIPASITFNEVYNRFVQANPTVILPGYSLNFNSNISQEYDTIPKIIQWNFGKDSLDAKSNTANPQNIYYGINQIGFKYISLTVTSGSCRNVITDTIALSPDFNVNLGLDRKACERDTIKLDAGAGNGKTYVWSQNSKREQTFLATQSGEYSVKVTNEYGLTRRDTVKLQFLPFYLVDLGSDINACKNDSLALVLDALSKGTNYLWSSGENTQKITVTKPGIYWVDVYNENICTDRDSITIKLNNPPIIDIGKDTTLCQYYLIYPKSNEPITKYKWSNGDTTSYLQVKQSGLYILEAFNQWNCKKSDSINVVALPSPYTDLGNDTVLCIGQQLKLKVKEGYKEYLWNTGTRTNSINVTTTGKYKVQIKNDINCIYTDSINVSYPPSPYTDLGKDTTLCLGNGFTLTAKEGYKEYVWNTGSTNRSIIVTTSGKYKVAIKNDINCVYGDSINITALPAPYTDLGKDTSLCPNQSITLTANEGYKDYLWNTGSTNRSINVTTSGKYKVYIKNDIKCTYTDSINVSFLPLPYLYSGKDTTVCPGQTLTLAAKDGYKEYLWNTGSTNRTIEVATAGKYKVNIKNGTSCIYTDSIVVDYAPCSACTKNCDSDDCFDISIFPNPSKGVFNLLIGKNQNVSTRTCPPIEYHIYDVLGKSLVHFSDPESKGNYIINVSHFISGLYLIKIQSGDKKEIKKIEIVK